MGGKVFDRSQALAQLADGGPCDRTLIRGQGVSTRSWKAITTAAYRSGVSVVSSNLDAPHLSGLSQQDPDNVLIANPRRTEGNGLKVDLRVAPDCLMLRDRDNGALHLPGMLVLEAMLQCAQIAVDLLIGHKTREQTFVSRHCDITFGAFTFPIPATINAVIAANDHSGRKHQWSEITTKVRQLGRESASAKFTSTLIDSDRLGQLELQELNSSLNPRANT
ncbi:AfsA-related hotdog domain-containing protein [Natronoglycomyces albus]|uniref:A-factor biosynthesis hotdog domain-containing protein n=1 Tax=Natronoglycomyces albus TaxID=2811108 RepID=A0A895XLA7_9ACTN|nr:AfsA-related hotdog domain-containing protein [Natronoglycomyces albus]QSB06491.1 hypothetical protein JQS30_06200 [Natronoglycomyces albus]